MSDNPSYSSGVNFPIFIIIFAGVFHIVLIIIICYFACCRRENVSHRHRSQLMSFRPGRRNSCNYDNRTRANPTSNDIDDEETHADEAWSSPQCQNINPNLRPITNWQTSLLARVRQHLRLTPQPPPSPPPAYSVRDESGGAGIANQGVVLDNEHALPSYSEYVDRLPSWYSDDSLDFDVEKPPPYEEAVKKPSDH